MLELRKRYTSLRTGRSYGGSPPIAIQKASLPLLAAFGRLRGYKPKYD